MAGNASTPAHKRNLVVPRSSPSKTDHAAVDGMYTGLRNSE